MPQLTLSQRSSLANSPRFQQRLKAAMDKTANYWNGSPYDGGGNPRALVLADYNKAYQKRKRFAKYMPQANPGLFTASSASFFLAQFNDDPIVLEDINLPFNAESNQISDNSILNSSVLSTLYDLLAGVTAQDAAEPIDW